MNSFELNKVLGAILGTCLITLALNIGAGAIFSPEKPAKPGYAIAVKKQGGGKSRAAKEQEQPMEAMMASASVEKGQRSPSSARPAIPSKRAAPTGSAPISVASSATSAARTAAASISPPP